MTNPVAALRTERDLEGRPRQTLHLGCPGCGGAHAITVEQQAGMSGPVWEWDGNLEAPTVSPSILVQWTYADRGQQRCHSFLRAGSWEFLSDSTHELAGQTVAMKPLPDWLVFDPTSSDDAQEG